MFNTKIKLIISVLAAVFILLADAYLFWLIGMVTVNIADIGTKIDTELRRSENSMAVKSLMEKTKTERAQLENNLIPHDGEVEFIELLESFGGQIGARTSIDGVSFEAVKISSTTPMIGDLEIIKVRLQVTGDWSQINSYLYLVENLPYRTTIDRLDTVLGGESVLLGKNTKRSWNLTMDISVYKKK